MAPKTKPLLSRFWSKVQKTKSCWNWKAYLDTDGYGQFTLYHHHPVKAHRFSYELIKGKIPNGLCIDHLCKNRACVNPEHMEPVTPEDNVRRGLTGKINHWNGNKTHCKKGHKFSEQNTGIYKGHRYCKLCNVMRFRVSSVEKIVLRSSF